MINLTLDDETEALVVELGAMWGLEGTAKEIVSEVLRRSLDLHLNPAEAPESTVVRPSITNAVEAITNFDPRVAVEISCVDTVLQERRQYCWEDLSGLTADPLVVKAAALGEKAQAALTDLYNAIGQDLWGTLKAKELFGRQLKFYGVEDK